MTTATQTASAIRFIMKDYNVWPNGTLDSQLKVYSTSVALDDTKILAIDKSLRRKYLEVNPTYVIPDYKATPLPLTIEKPEFNQFMTEHLVMAYGEVFVAGENLRTDPATLPQFELAVEKLEYFTQLFSALKALQNPQVWAVKDKTNIISLIIGGGYGDPAIPADFRNIYVSTQVNAL